MNYARKYLKIRGHIVKCFALNILRRATSLKSPFEQQFTFARLRIASEICLKMIQQKIMGEIINI